MIPKKIKPYFKPIFQNTDEENSLTEGIITCCNSYDFELFVAGEIKCSMFSKMHLIPKNDEIALELRCKKCGKIIPVFNSYSDGYEQCDNKQPSYIKTKQLNCRKCRDSYFSVAVKYEYPAIKELEELEIAESDNAFTWIWITIKCSKCGTVYKKFIDYETA